MKKIFLAAALIAALALTGCGNKNNDAANTPESNQTAEEQLANFGKDASKNVDMNKIEGEKLEEGSSAGMGKAKDKLGSYEVSIEDAKVIEHDGNKVVLVSFEFKNNSESEITFSGATVTSLFQGSTPLPPVVVTGVEGFDGTTLAQNVEKGEKIKVQRAYKLADEETPVIVRVSAFDEANNEGEVEKKFNLK